MSDDTPLRRTQEEWDAFFYSMAQHVATLSKDPDRKVGAVLVHPSRRQLSFGFNGFPAHIADVPSKLADREYKRRMMVHAEDNCLQQAPFVKGGASLYVTRFPCGRCAEAIVTARLRRVIAPAPQVDHPRWGKSWAYAEWHLNNEGIEVVTWNDASSSQ